MNLIILKRTRKKNQIEQYGGGTDELGAVQYVGLSSDNTVTVSWSFDRHQKSLGYLGIKEHKMTRQSMHTENHILGDPK